MQRAGASFGAALHDGKVVLLGVIPVFLKGLLGFLGAGKDHEAGGFAVETMDDEDTFVAVFVPAADVVGEMDVGGLVLLGHTGDGEEAGGLVDDDDVVVFKDDAELARQLLEGLGLDLAADGDYVALGEGMVVACHHLVIHQHGAELEPLLDLELLEIGELIEEVGQKRGGEGDGERLVHRAKPIRRQRRCARWLCNQREGTICGW